ncbi:MAG TPA: carboxylate--amine ligase, partial [Actinomycetota bacterium]|nr:carboxylate--amine ligase [Actinomycetota bacterium]
ENKWRAVRHGIDADIITEEGGTLRPIKESIRELVEELTPVATRRGCLEELRYALKILEIRPSYLRQRAVAESTGSLVSVVDSLIHELASDAPTPRITAVSD